MKHVQHLAAVSIAATTLIASCAGQRKSSSTSPADSAQSRLSPVNTKRPQGIDHSTGVASKDVHGSLLNFVKQSEKLAPLLAQNESDNGDRVESLKVAPLDQMPATADESQCDFAETDAIQSPVCLVNGTLYTDASVVAASATENMWGGPHIRLPHVRTSKTVTVCGVGFGVNALLYYACAAATGAIPPACTGMAAASAGSSCAVSVGTAAGICQVSVGTIAGAAAACIAQATGQNPSDIHIHW